MTLASGVSKPNARAHEPDSSNVCGSDRTSAAPWILHVADDRDLSNILKLRLEAYGVSVVQALDGVEGVHQAFTRPADAIILNYEMPHGNGEYVLKRLKQCDATKHLPIIVLTDRRDQGLEQRMLSLGADGVLNKPVCFDIMLDALRDVVPLQEPRGKACVMA